MCCNFPMIFAVDRACCWSKLFGVSHVIELKFELSSQHKRLYTLGCCFAAPGMQLEVDNVPVSNVCLVSRTTER